MNRAEKKFIGFAVLSIAVLLAVLLTIINLISFTMVATDADRITEELSKTKGEFQIPKDAPQGGDFQIPSDVPQGGEFFQFGPMGPGSPETNLSTRYFTVSFNDEGKAKLVAYEISAVTEEEAVSWAKSLQNESVGWTRGTYRYRVYRQNNKTYVTVIDVGRELLPCFRILVISLVGAALGILISFLALLFVGKKLFAPLEEADRKQKQFIAQAEKELKVPLTVIDANTEIIERENGSTEETRSIHRQVRKMTSLVRSMETLSVVEKEEKIVATVPLSKLVSEKAEQEKALLASKEIDFTVSVTPDIVVNGNEERLLAVLDELFKNVKQFALTKAEVKLFKQDERTILSVSNDADLPDGSVNQVFDRFTTLSNAKDTAGLGLAHVKEIVRSHNGRATASVLNGVFTVEIDL